MINPNYNFSDTSANGFYGNFFFEQQYSLRKRDKRNIRRAGTCTGLAVLSFFLIQNVLSVFIPLAGLVEAYRTSVFFKKGVDILLTLASILIAFIFFGNLMKKYTGVKAPVSYKKPESPLLCFLAFFSGMGLCMLANYATSFFSVIMYIFGYELYSPENVMPSGILGIIASVVQVVIVAAVAEELSLRGYVMGNLRPYGDRFAIFASSVIFALMHGNLVQAPFALIAGFGLGYFSVKTGSLWTGVLIHAGNNLLSVIMSYISDYYGTEVLVSVYYPTVYALIISGAVSFVIFYFRTKNNPLNKGSSVLTFSEKLSAFLSSPAMIAAIILMLIITSTYIVPIEQAVS